MNDLINIIPPKYHTLALLILALSPYVTRGFYAIVKGGGIKGIISAIWLGTNTPGQSQSSPPTANGGTSKAGVAALLFALGVASLLLTGCAGSLNKKAFDAEMTAATTAHVAMTGYGAYWDKAWGTPAAFNRTSQDLIAERQKVSAVSVKIGTGIEIVEGFRRSYETNSAVKPQLTAAITSLADNTGQLVPFVLSFITITNQ